MTDFMYAISGSSYTVAGPQFTEDSSAYVAGRSDIPVLMPNSEIRNPGYVTAFRMQGAVSGLLHIRVRHLWNKGTYSFMDSYYNQLSHQN